MATAEGAAKVGPDDGSGKGGSPYLTTIVIIYNGVLQSLEVNLKQSLQAVLQHALQLFGAAPGPVLFTEGGQELPLNQSVEDAHIVEGTRLMLRPRTVSGG